MKKEYKDIKNILLPIDEDFVLVRGHSASVILIEERVGKKKPGPLKAKENPFYQSNEEWGSYATVSQALEKYVRVKADRKDYDGSQAYLDELKLIVSELEGIKDLFDELSKSEVDLTW